MEVQTFLNGCKDVEYVVTFWAGFQTIFSEEQEKYLQII